MKKILFLFMFIPFYIQSFKYIYPVAVFNQDTLLVIKQKTINSIELGLWDKKTKQLDPVLWSLFNPASLRLLPDKSGFSFIDDGLLKIKFFNKRSPKTIPFDEPLYNISMVEWIDNNYCYASAKKGNHFGIFQLSIQGDVDCIIKNQFSDCLYPQKVDDFLFYIERMNHSYRIISIPYPKVIAKDKDNENNNFDIKVQKIIDKQTRKEEKNVVVNKQLIVDFKRQPIAFLHMISANEGFVLEYDSHIDTKDDTILFSYLHLTKNNNNWSYTQLFSFALLTELLLGNSPERLYESILPLLPRHIANGIYYVDAQQDSNLNIFQYDLDLETIKQKTKETNKHCFAPLLINGQVVFGGMRLDLLE
jgi:hypothetical protein